ncbi:MAG: lipocalin family protein [Pseudomonadota bacterium]
MMKRMFWAATFLVSSVGYSVDLGGVKGFEPERYLGTWYQVQSTNPWFQRGCKCTKAQYSAGYSNKIDVLNTCYLPNGTTRDVVGTAKINNPDLPSQLTVKFSRFTPDFVNYVVTEVGPNYEYSVVVSPGNSPIWILSREKTLDPSIIAGIRMRLVQAGVRIGDLKDFNTNDCPGL